MKYKTLAFLSVAAFGFILAAPKLQASDRGFSYQQRHSMSGYNKSYSNYHNKGYTMNPWHGSYNKGGLYGGYSHGYYGGGYNKGYGYGQGYNHGMGKYGGYGYGQGKGYGYYSGGYNKGYGYGQGYGYGKGYGSGYGYHNSYMNKPFMNHPNSYGGWGWNG